MNKLFLGFRYVSWVSVASSLIGAVVMSYIGATTTAIAIYAVFVKGARTPQIENLGSTDLATTYLVKSLDAFLIALVLFVFAFGVYSLFIADQGVIEKEEGSPRTTSETLKWVHIPNISHLKNILAELVVIILFVKFLEQTLVAVNAGTIDWMILTLPASIFLLAAALKLLHLRHD